MHFTLFSVSVFFMLTIFVQSAPTALDAATLLQNAQEAQKLNAQFKSGNGTASGSCNNGDTTCVKNAIATCVNGQFHTSNGCTATQQCFALPSVKSNGTIIACTSQKSAQSLINASGATGDVTGSGGSRASSASGTTAPMGSDYMTTPFTASEPTAVPKSVVTVTVTLTPSAPTTLPPVTQTLSPKQASSVLASLLAQGGPVATGTPDAPDCSDEPPDTPAPAPVVSASDTDTQPTATPDCSDEPSGAPTSAAPSVTDIHIPVTVIQPTATPSATSGSASSATAAPIANNASGSAVSGSSSGVGGYNGY